MSTPSPIVPPFTAETAYKKVKIAQDLWNTKTPEKVALAYTVCACTRLRFIKFAAGDADVWHNMTYLQEDTVWRNRDCFMKGRDEVIEFLRKKWAKENGYRLRKELFAFMDNKIAVQVRAQLPSALSPTTVALLGGVAVAISADFVCLNTVLL